MPEAESREHALRKKRRLALAGVFVSAALCGAADLFLYYSHAWTKVGGIVGALPAIICVYLWCRYDCALRNKRVTEWRVLAIIFLTILAIPAYLVETRGWKRALKLGLGLPAFIAYYAVYYGTWYACDWLALASGYYAAE